MGLRSLRDSPALLPSVGLGTRHVPVPGAESALPARTLRANPPPGAMLGFAEREYLKSGVGTLGGYYPAASLSAARSRPAKIGSATSAGKSAGRLF